MTRSYINQQPPDVDYHLQTPPRLHFKMSVTRNTTSWEWEGWTEKQDGEKRWRGRSQRWVIEMGLKGPVAFKQTGNGSRRLGRAHKPETRGKVLSAELMLTGSRWFEQQLGSVGEQL